jgi:hypothetical protein
MMKEELIDQKGVVRTRLNTLAKSNVLKKNHYLMGRDDLISTLALEDLIERQIKQMVNKDDKKRMFSTLRFYIKGSINPASIVRSSMSRIDITQQDGSIVAEITKEGIERHLLTRNPRFYRAAGLSPFGNTEMGRRLGPFGSSPLATQILEGTFRHEDKGISIIAAQVQRRTDTPPPQCHNQP